VPEIIIARRWEVSNGQLSKNISPGWNIIPVGIICEKKCSTRWQYSTIRIIIPGGSLEGIFHLEELSTRRNISQGKIFHQTEYVIYKGEHSTRRNVSWPAGIFHWETYSIKGYSWVAKAPGGPRPLAASFIGETNENMPVASMVSKTYYFNSLCVHALY
jgi:hypothetical protein